MKIYAVLETKGDYEDIYTTLNKCFYNIVDAEKYKNLLLDNRNKIINSKPPFEYDDINQLSDEEYDMVLEHHNLVQEASDPLYIVIKEIDIE